MRLIGRLTWRGHGCPASAARRLILTLALSLPTAAYREFFFPGGLDQVARPPSAPHLSTVDSRFGQLRNKHSDCFYPTNFHVGPAMHPLHPNLLPKPSINLCCVVYQIAEASRSWRPQVFTRLAPTWKWRQACDLAFCCISRNTVLGC